jgi:hypothetical protein
LKESKNKKAGGRREMKNDAKTDVEESAIRDDLRNEYGQKK